MTTFLLASLRLVITTGADVMDKIFIAAAREGIPALVAACQAAGWRVGASLETLHGIGVRVLFDPDAPYERRLPPWHEVVDALPVRAGAG